MHIFVNHIRVVLKLFLIFIIPMSESFNLDSSEAMDEMISYYSEARSNETQSVYEDVSGFVKLCVDSEPDGVAYFKSNDGFEYLIIFKVDSFWIIEVDKVVRPTLNHTEAKNYEPLFRGQNQLSSTKFWPNYLRSPNYVLSFIDLDPNDAFHNNILIFKERKLHRYRVDDIVKDNESWKLNITLLSTHVTDFWVSFPSFNDIRLMTIITGSKVLYVQRLSFILSPNIYILNVANLDNPIEYPNARATLPNLNLRATKISSYININDKTISFSSEGQVCVTDKCITLRDFMTCDPRVDAFTSSLAYFLWRETELSIRLIIVGLCTIMIINLVIALAFVVHQIERIADLT